MENAPRISIVVATYNRCDGLKRLLHALADQAYPADQYEVVVIDDGSTDATPQLLRTIRFPYALRAISQANGGPAAARNLGVSQARGSLILFLDDDVVPPAGLVGAHLAAHADAEDRVVTGPMLAPPPDWPQPVWDRWDAAQLAKQYRAMLDGVFACSQRQFFTANASVHRQLFLAAGGFDPTFRRAEDMELAWRMSAHGARFVFDPRADVVHYAARTFSSWRNNAYQYGRYDVVMSREKAIPAFQLACREFHRRRRVNQWLTRLCVGRRRIHDGAVIGLVGLVHLASRLGVERAASFALSSIFNLQYWQGFGDELGGPAHLWEAIAARGALGPVPAPHSTSNETVGHPVTSPVLSRR